VAEAGVPEAEAMFLSFDEMWAETQADTQVEHSEAAEAERLQAKSKYVSWYAVMVCGRHVVGITAPGVPSVYEEMRGIDPDAGQSDGEDGQPRDAVLPSHL